PSEDALAIRLRTRQLPRRRARRDDDGVGLDLGDRRLATALADLRDDAALALEAAVRIDDADAGSLELLAHVGGLRRREAEEPRVDDAEVDRDPRLRVRLAAEAEAELARDADGGRRLGG